MPTAQTNRDETILEGLIDYAGLYPPASLPLKSVIEHWSAYIQSEDQWILARLIIPATKLSEFVELASSYLPSQEQEPWQLSVLLPPASSEQFEGAMHDTIAFNELHCGAVANVVEFKATTIEEVDSSLSILHDDLFPFIELPIDEDPRGLIAALSGAVAGAKVRTGGVTPDLYPTPQHLARFIHACAISNLPFKATAGMHHPCRNNNSAVGVEEFGFFNVLAAATASKCKEATVSMVEQILLTEHIELSMFTEEELAETRAEVFCSVGSCSFDDPRVDLRALGLLKEST